jgi:hypothetical protein
MFKRSSYSMQSLMGCNAVGVKHNREGKNTGKWDTSETRRRTHHYCRHKQARGRSRGEGSDVKAPSRQGYSNGAEEREAEWYAPVQHGRKGRQDVIFHPREGREVSGCYMYSGTMRQEMENRIN